MKRVKRTITIEVETERSVGISVRPGWASHEVLCHQLEAADVHFEKANDGQVFICRGSTPNTEERSINSQHLVHNVRKEEEQ